MGADTPEPIASPDDGVRMEWDSDGVGYVAEINRGHIYLCAIFDNQELDRDLELAPDNLPALETFIRTGQAVVRTGA